MNHKLLIAGNRQKHYKSEFIYKLVDIMKNFPNLLRWTENGQSIQLLQIDEIEKKILPKYFRHSKLQSFIRQVKIYIKKKLHLYNFKQKKQLKSQLIFQHEKFKKGNQSQFMMIQRTKNKKQKMQLLKELEKNNVLKSIIDSDVLSEEQKQILSIMYSYKLVVIEKQKGLRQKLGQLHEGIKSHRNKKISEIENALQDQVQLELQSLRKFSKSIDIFLTETLAEKQKEPGKKADIVIAEQAQQKEMEIQERRVHQVQKVKKHEISKQAKDDQQPQFKIGSNQFPSHKNMIQLSGNGIQSNDNQILDYQQLFQNQHLHISTPNTNSLQDDMGQQQLVSTEKMNTSNQMNLSIDMFTYQKQPSLLFMPLPFYNRSAASEFFDWPNNKSQIHEEKQNNKQELHPIISDKSKGKFTQKIKLSQQQVSIRTRNYDCDKNIDYYPSEESEISFMNGE